jgi:hypothetical protein
MKGDVAGTTKLSPMDAKEGCENDGCMGGPWMKG